MVDKTFDVIIVGAGPAGAACALALAESGLTIGILEKEKFPRDKTCGDALSVDVLNQLEILSPGLAQRFHSFGAKTPATGVRIFAPSLQPIDIPFLYGGKARCGYLCTRVDFDNLLAEELRRYPAIQLFESSPVHQIAVEIGQAVVYSDRGTFHAKIVIGADGAHSIVSKYAGLRKPEKNHTSAGLRVYYEGVTALHQHQFIELHFCKEILPGYLWLFPLPDGKANVGLGMLSREISRKRINLRETLHHLLTHHDHFKERFNNARPLETVKGFSLPLGSRKRKISGERYLLAGDAASLIDPFTGEGIGNALRSGRVAAHHVQKCFASGDFSASFNKRYDSEIYNLMWGEFRISRGLQRLSRYPWLFNLVVRKANEHPHIQGVLTDALAQADKKQLLLHPRFYYRLLFS